MLKSSFLGVLAILLIGASGIVFKVMPKAVSWLFCVTSGLFFLLTPTRTYFLVALVALVVMIALTARKRRGLILSVVIGIFSFGAYNIINKYMEETLLLKEQRFENIYEHGLDPSMQSRLDEIVHAWGLFTENLIIGIGVGHRYKVWRHWVNEFRGPGYYHDNFLHSDFMNFLAKLGIVGILLYYAFYIKICTISWKVWKGGSNDSVKASGLIAFLLLVFALVAGQSTPIIQTRSDCLFLGFVMGYIYCTYRLMVSNGKEALVYVRGISLKYS